MILTRVQKIAVIRKILSEKIGIKRARVVYSLYRKIVKTKDNKLGYNVRLYRFKNLVNGKMFLVENCELIRKCFKFKGYPSWVTLVAGKCILLANEDTVVYQIEDKIFCYKFSTAQTVRIDTLNGSNVYHIVK